MPSVFDLLHRVRQHAGDDISIADGRALPEGDFVIAKLPQEDAAGYIVVHARPELFFTDVRESFVQIETDARPHLMLEQAQLPDPALFHLRLGRLAADLYRE